ncbi:hypothetical protein AVEN_52651-1 [Araneus ventricosus]|uniref:Uncharacterized protein n=1 Tax=Araneus ventricosus TaxID=182803 RepID=A0A4Y2N7R2_ARAVE|nr:hypothetical protein AVEN_52651-1 [Araneus ventricosus]
MCETQKTGDGYSLYRRRKPEQGGYTTVTNFPDTNFSLQQSCTANLQACSKVDTTRVKLVLQTHDKLALQGGVALVVTANLWQTRFASEGGDSALLVCHSFASSLTRQICHDNVISSENRTC